MNSGLRGDDSTPSDSADSISADAEDRFAILTDAYLDALQHGTAPPVDEYAKRHPEFDERLLQLLPTIVMMEQAGEQLDVDLATDAQSASSSSVPDQIGDFRIVRRIGAGGMGVVYEAEEIKLGRRVALKVLSLDRLDRRDRVERFRREAQLASRLHHTNIVPVFGIGEEEGKFFYAMQFIDGLPLSDLIRILRDQQSERFGKVSVYEGLESDGRDISNVDRSDGVEPSDSSTIIERLSGGTSSANEVTPYFRNAARFMQQAAESLAYAHSEGVVHRDVKPANLLLGLHGRLWITDFGLARQQDSGLTQTGNVLGTLRYMAPEQLGSEADSRSDVYSLGLTLYELLTLTPARDASDHGSLLKQVSDASVELPRKARPEIPADLETICLRCVEKEPVQRYQSAQEVADELGRFLRDEPIKARPISWLGRLARWRRRNPTVAALSGSLVVALLFGLIGVGWQWNRAEIQRGLAEKRADDALVLSAAASREERKAREAAAAEQAARKRESELLFLARINLMGHNWENSDIAPMERVLAQTATEIDGRPGRELLWNSWWNRTHSDYARLEFPGGFCRADVSTEAGLVAVVAGGSKCVVYELEADGNLLSSDVEDGAVAVRHRPGAELWRATHDESQFYFCRFSPSGQLLAVCGTDGSVRLFETRTGEQIREFGGHNAGVFCADFSRDERWLVTGGGGSQKYGDLVLHDLETGESRDVLPAGKRPTYNAVRFIRNDSQLLATQSNSTTFIVKLDGQRVQSFYRARQPAYSVEWAGEPQQVVTGMDSGELLFWDPDDDRELLERFPVQQWDGHDRVVAALAISPDGTLIASAGADRQILVRDLKTGDVRARIRGHSQMVFDLAFADEGRTLVSSAGDGTVRFWDLTRLPFREAPKVSPGLLYFLRISPDGRRLLTGGQGNSLRLWSLPDMKLLADLAPDGPLIADAVFLPPAESSTDPAAYRIAATGNDGALRVFQPGEPDSTTSVPVFDEPFTEIGYLEQSGELLCGRQGSIAVCDADSGRVLRKLKLPESRPVWMGALLLVTALQSACVMRNSWSTTHRVENLSGTLDRVKVLFGPALILPMGAGL
jgi:serine/threonine protein kinase/WD40 repeat protein